MQRERSGKLMELGILLIMMGVAVKLALWLGAILGSLASWAIIGGIIIVIIAAVTNRR
jgi:ABC-type multidrug transport system permease subunit